MIEDITKPIQNKDVLPFIFRPIGEQWIMLWFGDWSSIDPLQRMVLGTKCAVFETIQYAITSWILKRLIMLKPDDAVKQMMEKGETFKRDFASRFLHTRTKSLRTAYRAAISTVDEDGTFGCPMKDMLTYKNMYVDLEDGLVTSIGTHAIDLGIYDESGETTVREQSVHSAILAATCVYDSVACGQCRTLVPSPCTHNCMCGICMRLVYCSIACQRAHREEHRLSCFSNARKKKNIYLTELRTRHKGETWDKMLTRISSMQRVIAIHLWEANQLPDLPVSKPTI